MLNKRVFISAMYDVQIEPTLADRLHFLSAVMTRYHSNYYLLDFIPVRSEKVRPRVFSAVRLISERHDLSRHSSLMIDFHI
jgi:hypothetical protein